jgi:uncharacterized membrane protein
MKTSRTAKRKVDPELHVRKKVAGGATGALLGAAVAGPIGAVVGGAVGTVIGAVAEKDNLTGTTGVISPDNRARAKSKRATRAAHRGRKKKSVSPRTETLSRKRS